MSRPSQEAIETYVNITGLSEAAAIRKLEEHGGDLNEAVNAYLNEGDRNLTNEASVAVIQDDVMDVDDFDQVESQRRPFPLLSPMGNLDMFSLLDPNLRRNVFDSGTGFTRNDPIISHPRERREIPIEFKDGSEHSRHSGNIPAIVDITGTSEVHVPKSHGIVTVEDDDDDDENFNAGPFTYAPNNSSLGTLGPAAYSRPTALRADGLLDASNEIEEEMIKAAIEASKQDAPVLVVDDENDSRLSMPQHIKPFEEDPQIARAISLSLKTAEREKARRELAGRIGVSESRDHEISAVEDLGKLSSTDRLDVGSSSVNDEEADDIEEQPLVRHKSSSVSAGAGSLNAGKDSEAGDGTQLSTSQHRFTPSQPEGANIRSGEWGGISSEEQDEAVMLEAAMFGGIPDERQYRFPFPPHHVMQSDQNGNVDPYALGRHRSPSPSLTAQRMIREQQDDEYLAALQADREKEIKAKEEADAASAERRQEEEESLRRLLEVQEIERQIAAKEASLPKEPRSDDENAVTLLVRMPDGSRRGRRFLQSDKLQSLFDFIDVGGGVKPGTYRLVRPYPRRAFSNEESGSTLNELSITSKQEALYLEPV